MEAVTKFDYDGTMLQRGVGAIAITMIDGERRAGPSRFRGHWALTVGKRGKHLCVELCCDNVAGLLWESYDFKPLRVEVVTGGRTFVYEV